MARGTQHRKRRPPRMLAVASGAGEARSGRSAPTYEDQLFFGRLRVHAKWVFVFLALVFALGFVFLGVGSGSTGHQRHRPELLQRHLAGGSSLSSLQKKTQEHPKDAEGVARLREQAPAEEQARRRRRGAHDLHRS